MKNIGSYYYDETGACPVCGAALVRVPLYSGKALNTNVRTSIQGNSKVRTTTTTYTDLQPLFVGYCMNCAERAHAAREETKAGKKPKPTFVIIWAALLVVSLALFLSVIRRDGTIDAGTTRGVLGIVGLFLSFPAIIGVPWSIAAFVSKNRQYRQYASGQREPFQPSSEAALSRSAAYYMNKQPSDRTYLSVDEVKRMR